MTSWERNSDCVWESCDGRWEVRPSYRDGRTLYQLTELVLNRSIPRGEFTNPFTAMGQAK